MTSFKGCVSAWRWFQFVVYRWWIGFFYMIWLLTLWFFWYRIAAFIILSKWRRISVIRLTILRKNSCDKMSMANTKKKSINGTNKILYLWNMQNYSMHLNCSPKAFEHFFFIFIRWELLWRDKVNDSWFSNGSQCICILWDWITGASHLESTGNGLPFAMGVNVNGEFKW